MALLPRIKKLYRKPCQKKLAQGPDRQYKKRKIRISPIQFKKTTKEPSQTKILQDIKSYTLEGYTGIITAESSHILKHSSLI